MLEYIERVAAIATIAKHMANVNELCYSVNHSKEQYDIYAMATNHAIDYLCCVPAADVAPVAHGEWIEKTDSIMETYYVCSACDEVFYLIDGTPTENIYNFCPNCGADMRERKGDD